MRLNLKTKLFLQRAAIIFIIAAVVCVYIPEESSYTAADATQSGFVKWADFNIPYSALDKAMNLDIRSHNAVQLHWVEILSFLGAKYGGNWKRYRSRDMDSLAAKLKNGSKMEELTANLKNYNNYYEIYDAVLDNFVGDYSMESKNADGVTVYEEKYGLKVFSPVAAGYGYGHYDDFGNSRSFGFSRRHLGNDLMGNIGTPIIAVEGGYIESIGWNKYGGWRIGIRSFDKKRYYYYAHMRKDHPYRDGLKEGSIVRSGDVIGYLGMTGYSTTENVNKMQKPHLHFGMQLIFDESQKDSNNEIWIDVYDIVNLLQRNRSQVVKQGKDYMRVNNFTDLRYSLYYE